MNHDCEANINASKETNLFSFGGEYVVEGLAALGNEVVARDDAVAEYLSTFLVFDALVYQLVRVGRRTD